jgi:hypothetical protein
MVVLCLSDEGGCGIQKGKAGFAQPASRLLILILLKRPRAQDISRGQGAICATYATSASDRLGRDSISHIDRGASRGRDNASHPDLRNSGNAVGRTPTSSDS